MELMKAVKLFLQGYAPTRMIKKPGWRKPIQHYAFHCPIHGIVEDYPHGYEGRLECPRCRDEAKALEHGVTVEDLEMVQRA